MTDRSPIGVGGVGGSGTRVVAAILESAGLYLGNDLNGSIDNLTFGLLFANPNVWTISDKEFQQRAEIFCSVMSENHVLDAHQRALVMRIAGETWPMGEVSWIRERAAKILEADQTSTRRTIWGWKAPPTHIVLDRITAAIPQMKYIHIMRNGLDMAFSDNQNQLKIYGPALLEKQDVELCPRSSLKYWKFVNERALEIGDRLGDRFLLVKFEELCEYPAKIVSEILEFSGIYSNGDKINDISQLVKRPSTINRHRNFSYDDFDIVDIDFASRHFTI